MKPIRIVFVSHAGYRCLYSTLDCRNIQHLGQHYFESLSDVSSLEPSRIHFFLRFCAWWSYLTDCLCSPESIHLSACAPFNCIFSVWLVWLTLTVVWLCDRKPEEKWNLFVGVTYNLNCATCKLFRKHIRVISFVKYFSIFISTVCIYLHKVLLMKPLNKMALQRH